MAQAILEAERLLPYAAADLCKLVGDVRNYPDFIPWLQRLHVIEETPRPDGGWEGVAEATVGWHALTERFSTRVRCAPEEGAVDVELVKGPFKSLVNRWRFKDAPQGAQVRFWIAYEFKNPVLQGLLKFHREHAARRIMRAFEEEAGRRLGAPAPR
jgi:coenzyme Q-binding protein COQ10